MFSNTSSFSFIHCHTNQMESLFFWMKTCHIHHDHDWQCQVFNLDFVLLFSDSMLTIKKSIQFWISKDQTNWPQYVSSITEITTIIIINWKNWYQNQFCNLIWSNCHSFIDHYSIIYLLFFLSIWLKFKGRFCFFALI